MHNSSDKCHAFLLPYFTGLIVVHCLRDVSNAVHCQESPHASNNAFGDADKDLWTAEKHELTPQAQSASVDGEIGPCVEHLSRGRPLRVDRRVLRGGHD